MEEAQAAAHAAVAEFGRIDVLVNNAGNFHAGFFEELSTEQVRSQIEPLTGAYAVHSPNRCDLDESLLSLLGNAG